MINNLIFQFIDNDNFNNLEHFKSTHFKRILIPITE